MPTRRTVLHTIGAGVIASTAGCAASDSSTANVTLEIANNSDRALDIHLRVLPADVSTGLSEETLFERWFEFGHPDSATATAVVEDAFESQKALVRVGNEIGVFSEYTYVPDCSEESTFSEELRINVTGLYAVTFRQNQCQ